jgi:hypothetical protein
MPDKAKLNVQRFLSMFGTPGHEALVLWHTAFEEPQEVITKTLYYIRQDNQRQGKG